MTSRILGSDAAIAVGRFSPDGISGYRAKDGGPLRSSSRREWRDGDYITCPRCEGQKYDRGSCGLCGNLGVLDENGERFHCDCRADDWVEGDNGAIRCETCGGYAGEPGTSIKLVEARKADVLRAIAGMVARPLGRRTP